MLIAVTGSSGKLGRAVVADLLAHDHQVLALDRTPPAQDSGADFLPVDLTDFGQVVGALTGVDERHQGVDAVVHLAAIPAPGRLPNAATFENNVPSTYHVFEACRLAGITNIVWASSETVLGLPFEAPPPYAPVDEEYRVRPESTYSLGKAVEEEMAYHFCRWNPELKIHGLRFSNVMEPHDYARFSTWQDDPAARRWNLWGYIDGRDGAQAVRKSLLHSGTGFEAFIIANADTVMNTPSRELMAAQFPDVEVRDVAEFGTLLSIDKARRVLGYEPEHSWRPSV